MPQLPKNYPASRDEAIELLGLIRKFTIHRIKLTAQRDAKVKAIDDDFAPQLAETTNEITELDARLEVWAELNPKEFGEAKSITCLHGTFGWRLGNWSVKAMKPLNFDKILHTLKQLGHGAMKYIRTKEEVDKEQLLADREFLEANDGRERKKIGIRFEQPNRWFVDPNTTDPNA